MLWFKQWVISWIGALGLGWEMLWEVDKDSVDRVFVLVLMFGCFGFRVPGGED